MAIRPKDIYEGTKKTHRTSKIITTVIILLIALAIGLFFGLRQYCVYDDEGNATLIMPWNRKDGEDRQDDTGRPVDNTPAPSPAGTEPFSPEPGGTDAPEDTSPDTPDTTDPQPDTGDTVPSDTTSDAPSDAPDQDIGQGVDADNP